jgi:selenocysteine lyase/cysteine desulfurase
MVDLKLILFINLKLNKFASQHTHFLKLIERITTHLLNLIQAYEYDLFQEMESGIRAIPGVRMYGHATVRTPTIYFTIDGNVICAYVYMYCIQYM